MKKSYFSLRSLSLGLAVALGITFVSCNKFDDDDNGPGTNTPVAGLMAFNLASDKNSVGVALNGNSITDFPLTYTSYTGNYVAVFAGQRSLQTFDFNNSSSLVSSTFSFDSSRYYSLFFVGADSNYKNVIVNDNFDSLSGSNGQAYVRYINAIADSSAPNVTIAANGSNVVNTPASYASVSEFVAVAPGQVSVAVTNGGTIDASRNITLTQKKAYTVLLLGNPSSAVSGDSVQIRFIENGTLSDDAGRTSAAGRSAVAK